MKKRKTFIVLFDLGEISDSRKKAEDIENRVFLIKNPREYDEVLTAYELIKSIIEELEIPLSLKDYVTVYPITDFMDLYNNEECNEVGTFMSYVHAEISDEVEIVDEKPVKKITKKAFKELASHHLYKGGGRTNVFYYDWKEIGTGFGSGYKYAVASDTENMTKKELLDVLYDWVVNEVQPPYTVRYKYAMTDENRFKVSLILNF